MEKTAEEAKTRELYASIDALSEALSLSPTYASEAETAAHEAHGAKAGKMAKAGAGLKYKFEYWLSRIVQGLFWPVFYVGYHLAFSLRIKGRENLKGIKEPVIFVANHVGVYDSFIFDLFTAPWNAIPPYRFMGTLKFEISYLKILKYTGIVQLIYVLFGVFKVNYGEGAEKALVPAKEIIKNGGTVAIFPEGRVWRYDRYGIGDGHKEPIGPFKWGAAILAKNTGALVVPVSFNQHRRNWFRDYLDVNIGVPYKVDRSMAPEVLTEEMRGKVVGLFETKQDLSIKTAFM